jgi:hypothetical protein
MDSGRITWSSDVAAADWIVHRLAGPTGTVGSLMPSDFGAYGRILHPGDAAVPPAQGALPADLAAALASIAAEFTTTPQRCWFAVWHGYGWLYPSRSAGGLHPTRIGTLAWLPNAEGVPRVHLPNREFLLYTGPIGAATALIGYPTRQTPNLWWPDDRAWYIATDIDLTTTYIGGSLRFIDRILAEPRFAATRASLTDPLVGGHEPAGPPL